MITFLSTNILYIYNDMAIYFVQALSKYNGKSYFPLFSNAGVISNIDYINNLIMNFIFSKVPPIFAANLISILYLLITLVFSYLLFNRLIGDKFLGILFAILFTFNLYYLFRVISFTPNIYQVFFFPLTFYLLHFYEIRPSLLGLLLFLFFSFSSYLAFFTLLFVLFWYLFEAFYGATSWNFRFLIFIKKSLTLVLTLGVLIISVYFSLLRNTLPALNNYQDTNISESFDNISFNYRPLEDWYNLSLRPWYFVVPPRATVFFADFSKTLHHKISDTGYYLADDYMEEEMAGAYMGWHFILGLIFVGFLISKDSILNRYPKFKGIMENKILLRRLLFILFMIFLFSLPPSITIKGLKIYTPTYLSYLFFPVFRTLVRWSVVIYFLIVIINMFLFKDLLGFFKNRWLKFFLVSALLLMHFAVFAVNVPVVSFLNPPSEMIFLRDALPENSSIAVFPSADYYNIFWVLFHQKMLANPTGFSNSELGIDSKTLTESLVTFEGLTKGKSLGVTHLLVDYSRISSNRINKISQINSQVDSHETLDIFFSENFGEKIYSADEVSIYVDSLK